MKINILRPNKKHIELINRLSEFMEDNNMLFCASASPDVDLVLKIDDSCFAIQNSQVFPINTESGGIARCSSLGMILVYDENYKPLY